MNTDERAESQQDTAGGAESGNPALEIKPPRGAQAPEVRIGVVALGLVVFVGLFVGIAAAVRAGGTLGFDRAILEAFRRGPDLDQVVGPRAFATLMRQLTDLGSASVMLLLSALVAGYLLLNRQLLHAAQVLLATVGGAGLGWAIKHLVQRPRPTLVPMLGEVHSWSFPSGHATMSTVVYLTLGMLVARFSHTRLQKIYVMSAALGLVLIIGLSRIVMGVHFPTDVLAGWALGLSWTLVVWFGCDRWERRFSSPAE